VNLIAFEVFADAVGASHQIENVGGVCEFETPQCVFAGDLLAVEDGLSESAYALVIGHD
jgi:hypothetical protein